VTVTPQLRAILLAGTLAALALVLGFMTLARNQADSSAGTVKAIVPLHLRAKAKPRAAAQAPAAKAVAAKPVAKPDANVAAALAAGLPRGIAVQLGAHRVVVVQLFSGSDEVDRLARDEAAAGAKDGGAGFVAVNVDRDNADAAALTRVLGSLPPAPASLVYVRPAALYVTLAGFNDHTTVRQAAANAAGGGATPAAA
jgi:hypothetical protein